MPEFVAANPRYERTGLRDLSTQIHDAYKGHDVARVTTEMYLSEMQPAMKPSDAYECLTHGRVDRVPIDELLGRITTMCHSLSPGIPLLIPGERFTRDHRLPSYPLQREVRASTPSARLVTKLEAGWTTM